MAEPNHAERHGPYTRYHLPSKRLAHFILERGSPPPTPSPAESARLASYTSQRWRITGNGRTIACSKGALLQDASVIVQLYAASLTHVLPAHEQHLEAKARARAKLEFACYRKGVEPPPETLTREEQSWAGGPGFNVSLANGALHDQLAAEQEQGFPFTVAAVGDGSWDPQTMHVSRSALLNDGRVLGGSIDVSDVVGGARNNYDGESAHRLDVLAIVPGERLFYIFDSTSPITASERFRRLSTSARSRCDCDDWLGTGLVLENDMQMVALVEQIAHRPLARGCR